MQNRSNFWSLRWSSIWIAALAVVSLASALGSWFSATEPIEIGPVAQWAPEALAEPLASQLAEADALYYSDRIEEAESRFHRIAQGSDLRDQAWGLNGQARVAQRRQTRHRALDLYQQSFDRFRQLGDRARQAMVLHNMASCFSEAGDQDLARDFYEKSLDFYTNNAALAISLIHLATLEGEAGDPELARAQLRQALGPRLSNLAEDPQRRLRGKAIVLDRLASAISVLEPDQCKPRSCVEQAEVAYRSALQILEDLEGYELDAAVTRANLGWLAIHGCSTQTTPCEPAAAQALFEEALGRSILDQHPDYHLALLTGRITTIRLLGDLDSAQALADSGLRTLTTLSADEPTSYLRIAYRARHHPLWKERVAIEVERDHRKPGAGHARQALLLADLGRAQGLLEDVAQQSRDRSFREPSLTRQQMNGLERERLEISNRLRCHSEISVETLQGLLEKAADIEAELRTLEFEQARSSVEGGPRITPGAEALDHSMLSALQHELTQGTVVLYYHLGDERSALFWITSEELEVFDLPSRRQLRAQVLQARELIAKASTLDSGRANDLGTALTRLGELLLGPISPRLSDQRLVIVPDGVLHTLPFAALLLDEGSPLVRRHELAMVPSLAVWRVLRHRSESRQRLSSPEPSREPWLAVVADALYSGLDRRLSGFAIEDEQCEPPPPLPATRREARLFSQWVPPDQLRVFVEDEARREVLLDPTVRHARILHLAVHGVLEEKRPGFSHLLFSRFDSQGNPLEASRVFAHEIDDLSLEADLMVLSACDTGLGKLVRGEGLVGMSRSLLAAGVDRALITLWAVDDQATLELMKTFYGALFEDRASPVEALTRAQRSLLDSKSYQDPYYWAGFVLVGVPEWPGLPFQNGSL